MPVFLSVTIDDSSTGGSPVVAGEWFVDDAGGPGSGHALAGSYGGPQVTATATISTATLATLVDGAHAILVRGTDAAGNWGPLSTTALVVDRSGPDTHHATARSNPTQGASVVAISATIDDATSPVTAAEWFIGADPGPGRATPMTAADGAFDSISEVATGAVSTAGRSFGETIVSIRGRDAGGMWGSVARAVLMITPADGIFADGFESGTTGRWTKRVRSSSVFVTKSAAMAGTWGLALAVRSSQATYLIDTTPSAATSYHARFGFDARRLKTRSAVVDIFSALDRRGSWVMSVQYRRSSKGPGQVRVATRRAHGTTYTKWATLPDGRHTIEVGWYAASTSKVRLWVDTRLVSAATGVNTRGLAIETVRLGPTRGLTSSMAGYLRFDRFVSSRGSRIGP